MSSRISAQFWTRLEAAKTDPVTPTKVDPGEIDQLTEIAVSAITTSDAPRGVSDEYAEFFKHLGESEFVEVPDDVESARFSVSIAGQRRQVEIAVAKVRQFFASNPSTVQSDPDLRRVDGNSFRIADFGDYYYLGFRTTDGQEGSASDPAATKISDALGFRRLIVGALDTE